MAKKSGKVIFWGLMIGAAAAGTYHYLQNKKKSATAEEFDDFDNFEDADDTQSKGRHYVPLNLDDARAFVSSTIDKAKEAVSKVSKKLQKEDIEDDVIIDDIFDDSVEESDAAADGADTADTSAAPASDEAPEQDSSSTTEDFFDDAQ